MKGGEKMTQAINQLPLFLLSILETWKTGVVESIESGTVRYDGWFLVLLAVLMSLAFTIFAGLTIWCVVYQGGTFTGNWEWSQYGVSVKAECAT